MHPKSISTTVSVWSGDQRVGHLPVDAGLGDLPPKKQSAGL